MRPSPLDQGDDGVDHAVGKRVEQPDEHTHDDDAQDHDQRVVARLLRGGSLDLLQLAFQLTQPLGKAGKDAGLGFFRGLFGLLLLGGDGLLVLFHFRHFYTLLSCQLAADYLVSV